MNNCYLDAEAVITFFRMTGRKHIFITGSRGSGKSHLVNNMLKHMSDSFNLTISSGWKPIAAYTFSYCAASAREASQP